MNPDESRSGRINNIPFLSCCFLIHPDSSCSQLFQLEQPRLSQPKKYRYFEGSFELGQ